MKEYAYKNTVIDQTVANVISYTQLSENFSEDSKNDLNNLIATSYCGEIKEEYFLSALEKNKTYKK